MPKIFSSIVRIGPSALALVAAIGCGGNADARRAARAADRAVVPEVEPAAPPYAAGEASPLDEVRVVLGQCAESDDADCDAIDDDCDGVIDEGCGLASGVVQVTAAWRTGADIDLYVEEPLGDTLSFQRRRSAVGGRVDRVGRGACDASGAPSRTESLVWDGGSVLRGTYRIRLHYWGECQSLAGPTEVTVSVAVAGSVVATMTYVLSPNELKELATFVVD
jgi:hypothetical protein